MLKKIILLNKIEGETPLEALEGFRTKNTEYKDIPMTYAGRLDPMASGLLVVLTGEECKQKEKYLGLSKEYEFEVLFGFVTDTYDILGKVEHSHILKNVGMSGNKKEFEQKIKESIKLFTGTFTQNYPMYSSKTVKGKPLFEYAREGVEVERPEREVTVKNIKFIKSRLACGHVLLGKIEKRINRVKGNFRQKEIIKLWHKYLHNNSDKLIIGTFSISCSSGTYVRGIANSLGENLGIPALAYSIKRTKVGKWRLLG